MKKIEHPTKGSSRRKKGLNRKLLFSAIGPVVILVLVCYGIMIWSMRNLTDQLLLDNLQPLARQSAKAVESNIHLLADRMMGIAKDGRLQDEQRYTEVLDEARMIYELHTIGLYDRSGRLISGDASSPASLENQFFALLQETDNLTTKDTTVFQNTLGITMGMPVKKDGETVFYVVGVYKYDTLNDVLSDIHIGRSGQALMVGPQGQVTGSPDQSEILQGGTLTQLRGAGYQTIQNRLISGETGAAEVVLDGEAMFLSFSPVRGTQWALAIEVPKSDYAHLMNGGIAVISLVAFLLLTASVVWSIHTSKGISGPVGSMTERMMGLSEGDLHSAVSHTYSGDELEVLSNTLDNTVTSLNQYVAEIDRVLDHMSSGDLDITPLGEYKGDFGVIRISLDNIIGYMNETMGNFRTIWQYTLKSTPLGCIRPPLSRVSPHHSWWTRWPMFAPV